MPWSNRVKRAAGAALAAAAAALVLPAACVVAPPADPPQLPPQGPTIEPESAVPPTNGYVTEVPPGGLSFTVPVRAVNATQQFYAAVFIDYDPHDPRLIDLFPVVPSVNGATTLVSFMLTAESFGGDVGACHIIELQVTYDQTLFLGRTPAIGTDVSSINWHYAPGGPGQCDTFDAGDGAFPPDGPSEGGLFVTPDL